MSRLIAVLLMDNVISYALSCDFFYDLSGRVPQRSWPALAKAKKIMSGWEHHTKGQSAGSALIQKRPWQELQQGSLSRTYFIKLGS